MISPDAGRVTVRVLLIGKDWMIVKTGCRVLSIGPASEKKNSRHSPHGDVPSAGAI
ncbi:MAG: hypothetical protein ABSA23_12520 [Anaerolineales bacterium]